MKEVYNYLDSLNISRDETIIVAVSYGPDSMALLNILNNKYRLKIVCAHVHHNHREESNEEAKLLKEYCKKNNIIFEFMKIDKYTNNKFTEEEARKKRYEFFEELINKYNSKYLFTAHHGDDLIETVLMRLTRGSSLKGYSGISLISKRDNYEIVRPLLYTVKKDILKYCNDNSIPFAVDNSNSSLEYTRNRYRNNILPYLKEEDKDIHLKFIKFSNVLQKYVNYVDKESNLVYNRVIENNKINISKLIKYNELIIENVIRLYLLNNYNNDINKVTDKHVESIINLLYSKRTTYISLPNNKIITKSYNYAYFDNKEHYNEYCYQLEDYIELPNNYVIEKVDSLDNTTNYYCAFNKEDLVFPLYVRTKVPSDKIEVLNLNGSKKVKDIFIDSKLSIKERETQPILCDSMGNILWIPGIKKSKYDRSKLGKYDIILRYRKQGGKDETK